MSDSPSATPKLGDDPSEFADLEDALERIPVKVREPTLAFKQQGSTRLSFSPSQLSSGEWRLSEGPVSVLLPQQLDRPLDPLQQSSPQDELVDGQGLGHVLIAVDQRDDGRHRGPDVAPASPLADAVTRDAR